MSETVRTWVLWAAAMAVLAFLLLPLLVVLVYAFDAASVQVWPIRAFSLKWFAATWADEEVRGALTASLEVAGLATLFATVLGTLSALGMNGLSPRATQAGSFLLTLPIALPGVLTGIAMNSFFTACGIPFTLVTLVIAHTTFCMVIIHNNVIARLRRLPPSLAEAAQDMGATPLRSFGTITLPLLAGSIVSGMLLAFALSFDEVIVSTFTAGSETTLPLWIFGAIRLGQHMPEVNVVVFAVIAVTLVPIIIGQKLAGDVSREH
ncbi:ABC transporter permease [Acetobacter vaccinii]|uniref:Spermidine/putrescine transport system permease protein PotC n=1 Tax=Acetobacter vaccinii TaxID=2592655 RepID=A0A5C1YPJ6_9PROT|nr:ABC transporter permease [Acetobacter vaccinii]QEO17448.1 ABC transporter permease [Acetobacter vaccinii]